MKPDLSLSLGLSGAKSTQAPLSYSEKPYSLTGRFCSSLIHGVVSCFWELSFVPLILVSQEVTPFSLYQGNPDLTNVILTVTIRFR